MSQVTEAKIFISLFGLFAFAMLSLTKFCIIVLCQCISSPTSLYHYILHQIDQLSGQTTTTNFYVFSKYLRICHKNPDEKSARRPTVFNL